MSNRNNMDVTARLKGDNASFDSAQKRSAEVATASGYAMEQAAKKVAAAQQLASKFAGEAVDGQSKKIVAALKLQTVAQADFNRMLAADRAGYLRGEEGANRLAAAYKHLADVKKAAAAVRQPEEHAFASVRESIGGLRFGEAFDQVKAVAGIAAVAELASKMKEAVSSSLEFGEAMVKASDKTGLSVETLSKLHYVAATTGGDFDRMTTAVSRMEKVIGEATEGNKQAQQYMKALGLDANELAGRSDGAEIALRKLAATLVVTQSSIQRTKLSDGLMGVRGGADQIHMLVELGQNWDELSAKAQAAGVVLDEKTARSLAEANQRLRDLKESVEGAALAFTEGLAPGITAITDVIKEGKGDRDGLTDWGHSVAKDLAFIAEIAYSTGSALEFLFSASEGGKLSEIGRRDMEASKRMAQQAQEFHAIAFGLPRQADVNKYMGSIDPNNLTTWAQQVQAQPFTGLGGPTAKVPKDDAAQQQMKGFEDMLNRRKLDEQLTVTDEIAFWEAMLVPAQKYSDNVREIIAKLATLTQEYYRQLDAIAARAVEQQKRAAEQMQQEDAQMLSMMKQWEEQDSRRATAQAKLTEAQQRSADAIAEQAIQFQVMTGQLSKHDAALQLAAIHTADYRAQLEELDREEAEDAQRSTLTPEERETRAADRDIRRVQITGEATRTAAQDQVNIEGTTVLGGATDALREFTAAALDSAAQMRQLVSDTLNQFNDAILSDRRGRFRQAAGNVLKSGARSGLQYAEGLGLKALGINDPNRKPKGTQSDPIYVAMAKAAQQGSNGVANLISSLFGGDTANGIATSVSAGAGEGISGIFSLLSGLGGGAASGIAAGVGGGAEAAGGIADLLSGLAFFADGTGPLTADTWAMVGERGPEIVNLPRGSSVTPNHQLPKMGGDTYHSYSIDARGAHDPAAVEASVHRTMQQYVPGIIKASMGATRDAALRRPRTSY